MIAVFIQHYHTPDCATAARPYALVKRLAEEHEVTLITTNAWRARRLTRAFDWVPPGVRLVELDVPYRNAMATPARLRAFLTYAAQAVARGLRGVQPDLIYGSSTPLTAAAAAAAVARMRGVPWIFEVRDLWPDFPVQMGALPGGPLGAALRESLYALERRLYRSAAHVVAHSPDMAAHVRPHRADGVSVVEYGTDLRLLDGVSEDDVAAWRQRLGADGKTLVLYAGSFGRANDVPSLLRAARQLRGRGDLRFVIAGRGHHAPAVEAAAQQLPNVRALPPQPQQAALALFRAADLSLVPFLDRPVLAANAPSKLFDSLAAGTPVVVTNPGWTKALVEAHGCGWHVPAEQPAALARQIARLTETPAALDAAGRRGAGLARRRFDRAVQMNRLAAIIRSAVSS